MTKEKPKPLGGLFWRRKKAILRWKCVAENVPVLYMLGHPVFKDNLYFLCSENK